MAHHLLLYGADAFSILIAVHVLWPRGLRRSSWVWLSAALLALAFIGRTIYFFQTTEEWGGSLRHVWLAGSYALHGMDPYTVKALPPRIKTPSLFFTRPPPCLSSSCLLSCHSLQAGSSGL